MIYKKFKNLTLIILLSIYIIPQTIFAYSDYIVASGKTVGIKLNTDGIIVVGSYNINNHNPLNETDIKIGDMINSINNKKVNTIDDMVNIIKECNCNSLDIEYKNSDKRKHTILNLYEEDGVLKTGLYVKDTISGVGTLTFIDPNTKLFGVLGHEIAEATTGNIIDIKSGSIFNSKVTSITRSDKGIPGEKNAILYSDQIKGEIKENTSKGIFGNYTSNIDDNKLYKVAKLDDINIGKASILTVINNDNVEKFDINILTVNQTDNKLKNIEFEIIDENLLDKTNGIVQGMSGSPIVQGDNIIGAVTHVVVDNPHKGYGILITNMLEEAEN